MSTTTKSAPAPTTSATPVLDPAKVKKGDILLVMYWAKVDAVHAGGTTLALSPIDPGNPSFRIEGRPLVEGSRSADVFTTTEKVSLTDLLAHFIDCRDRPFTVTFTKKEGGERTLRGRYLAHEALFGRSKVEDLDIAHDDPKGRIRLVDHRTVSSLIVGGVKYVAK